MNYRKRFSLNDLNYLFTNFDNMFKPVGTNKNISKKEEGSDEFGRWIKETISSEDGEIIITSYTRMYDEEYDVQTSNNVELLKKKLEVCVEEQNYEEAAKLRDQIKKIESNKGQIDLLKKDLDIAVKEQNFEKAIELRDKIKELEA